MEEQKIVECKKENTIPADKAILHLNVINKRIICTFITRNCCTWRLGSSGHCCGTWGIIWAFDGAAFAL